jgi:hypothetical protein
MVAIMMAVLSVFAPSTVDIPPEMPIEVILWNASADQTAARGTQVQVTETAPPPETWPEDVAPPGLSNCDEMSWYRQRAGLPARFDQIGWRESNCRNEDGVHTSCCWGYWQLHRMHMGGEFGRRCGAWSVNDINSDNPGDKRRQACAAKLLYDMVGLSAWAATR